MEGAKALCVNFTEEGSLTLYASTVIFKDANGAITVKQAADEGPLGILAGLVDRQFDWPAGWACRFGRRRRHRHVSWFAV